MIARFLVYLSGGTLAVTGGMMLLGGEGWYLSTPGVSATGPFNPHFVLDIGFAYLASGVSILAGAWLASRPVMIAGLSWPVLHALLHGTGLIVHGAASVEAFWTETLGVMAPVLVGVAAFAFVPVQRLGLGGASVLHKGLSAFEHDWSYDAAYLHKIADMAPDTFMTFRQFQGLAQYRGQAPVELLAGATMAAFLEEDCGPCAQLNVDMMLAQGFSPSFIEALIQARFEDMSEESALGYRFAKALMRRDLETEELRLVVEREYGETACLAVAYAVLVSRSYPLLKRALGHAQACQKLDVGGQPQSLIVS